MAKLLSTINTLISEDLRSDEIQLETHASQIREWVEKCSTEHGKSCDNASKAGTLPKRIIELSTPNTARLIETPKTWIEYVALSYCWGAGKNFKTTEENIDAMRQCIRDTQLPPTLRDVFQLARSLGYRYLWVDALCIVQGNVRDWEEESRIMGQVYSNAHLVISSFRARGVDESLFGQPQNDSEARVPDDFHKIMQSCRSMSQKKWLELITRQFPLLSRAWAFQERLLARRIVHFTCSELVWECRHARWCPCGGMSGSDDSALVKVNNMHAAFDECLNDPQPWKIRPMWRECVKSYSRRALSFEDDRLAAIEGVAAILRGAGYERFYFEGLWKDALPFDLLWRCDQTTQLKETKSRGPSWSWASVDCGVDWPHRKLEDYITPKEGILSWTYIEHDWDGVEVMRWVKGRGTQSNSTITFLTRTINITIRKSLKSEKSAEELEEFITDWVIQNRQGDAIPFYPDVSFSSETKCQGIRYLELARLKPGPRKWEAGLVVRQRNGHTNEVERLGIAGHMDGTIVDGFESWFDGAMLEEVTLV